MEHRAWFGVCLYAAARINESCILLRGDVIGTRGIRPKLIIRAYNTKGGQDTREIQVHPKLKEFLEEYSIELKGRNPHLWSPVVTGWGIFIRPALTEYYVRHCDGWIWTSAGCLLTAFGGRR
jgi:hypothetical protein